MNRIKEIWNQLNLSNSITSGLFKIRYSNTSKCDLYLGIKCPEKNRILVLKTPSELAQRFNFKYEFKGLRFEKVYESDDSGYILLNLVLIDNQLTDIFNSLIDDIIKNIVEQEDYKDILKSYSNRLMKWQSLFERAHFGGLTPEEQRGLFGELYFLRNFLTTNSDFNKVITSWTGPAKEIRDFQIGNNALEVKTTHGNNHQKIHISSERQLDLSNLQHLFLYHISLDVRHQDGESLNQIVDSISDLLINDYIVLNSFNNKLLEAGFFNHHREIYKETGYYIRKEAFYKIEGEFPRIEEKEIRHGVGDVKYSIIVDNCQKYRTTETEVLTNLN